MNNSAKKNYHDQYEKFVYQVSNRDIKCIVTGSEINHCVVVTIQPKLELENGLFDTANGILLHNDLAELFYTYFVSIDPYNLQFVCKESVDSKFIHQIKINNEKINVNPECMENLHRHHIFTHQYDFNIIAPVLSNINKQYYSLKNWWPFTLLASYWDKPVQITDTVKKLINRSHNLMKSAIAYNEYLVSTGLYFTQK